MSEQLTAYYQSLLVKHMQGTATPAELAGLWEVLDQQVNTEQWQSAIQNITLSAEKDPGYDPAQWDPFIAMVLAETAIKNENKSVARVHFLRKWGWVAAIFILAIGSGIYYLNNQSSKSHKSSQITLQTKGTGADILPGTDKAIWILADGKQIELDSTVLDMTSKKEPSNNIGYNELRTPRGGQYQLILPDGSKVWLNAASSIKYPVAFEGRERKVEVSGEAYFEVIKDASKPFKVYGGDQEIEVLGTAFNVNIYNDEPSKKTTLVSGSIKVSAYNQSAILKPGEQASIPILSVLPIRSIPVQTTNIEQDLAWKNGFFKFNKASIQTIMRQLERWYDVEVIYQGKIAEREIDGEIPRNSSLSSALRLLNFIGVHFKVEGKTVTVWN